jgi:hypothetical protein
VYRGTNSILDFTDTLLHFPKDERGLKFRETAVFVVA